MHRGIADNTERKKKKKHPINHWNPTKSDKVTIHTRYRCTSKKEKRV